MRTGLERLRANDAAVRGRIGRRFGLLAHPASVVQGTLEHVSAILRELGCRPSIVFGPEHGYGGEAQDMIGVPDARDRDGVTVRSLYGDAFDDLSPRIGDLQGLDSLVIDLQDIGSRYYTYVWTAVLAMRAAMEAGVRVILLDRPNPIGVRDDAIEGRLTQKGFESFVGLLPVPIRHGLTIGEIVAHTAQAEGVPADALSVVRPSGEWNADGSHDVFVQPSPNMPTRDTALVYPGACLIEGTNLSEGRGTTRPFEVWGAPWIDGDRLAREVASIGIDGAIVRPVSFLPMFQKHAKALSGGVHVHVVDEQRFRPVFAYTVLIALARQQAPRDFRFRTERYEFVDDIPAFDLLTGSAETRERILAGEPPASIARSLSEPGAPELELVREARRSVGPYVV